MAGAAFLHTLNNNTATINKNKLSITQYFLFKSQNSLEQKTIDDTSV